AYAAGAAWAPQRLWRAVAASVAGHRLPGLPDAVAAGRRGSYARAWLAGQVLATGRRSNQWRARLLYAAGARAGPRRYGDAGVFVRAVGRHRASHLGRHWPRRSAVHGGRRHSGAPGRRGRRRSQHSPGLGRGAGRRQLGRACAPGARTGARPGFFRRAMSLPAPRLAYYGDDFTGATAGRATATRAGLRRLLFFGVPPAAQRERAGPLDCLCIAGATRAMAPQAMRETLQPVAQFLAALGPRVVHYKVCC